ncbi:response regulator [Terribacillus sp. 179-K 1B1 HS]|uniref:response regulator n=1 Tax=Terribacillus sp. 179-K 1B1 HS TaxID=3142388 RepID=UPI0039A0DFE1
MIKVLIVEDDPMVSELNKRYVKQMSGFTAVGAAQNYKEALEFMQQNEVDLLLLDVYMKGKNGIELLKEIRKRDQQVDAIIISAASEKPMIREALQYGAVDYLIKPFEFDRFQHALSGYRKRQLIFSNKEEMTQQELDSQLLQLPEQEQMVQLPKGLTRSTLKVVWNSILTFRYNFFTTEDIAKETEMSQVSVRKYLKFLEDVQLLEVEMHYGSIGRPVFKYRVNANTSHHISQYI